MVELLYIEADTLYIHPYTCRVDMYTVCYQKLEAQFQLTPTERIKFPFVDYDYRHNCMKIRVHEST